MFTPRYNKTPLSGMDVSPSQILMSRICRTSVPMLQKQLEPKVVNIHPTLEKLQNKVKSKHDAHARRSCVRDLFNVRSTPIRKDGSSPFKVQNIRDSDVASAHVPQSDCSVLVPINNVSPRTEVLGTSRHRLMASPHHNALITQPQVFAGFVNPYILITGCRRNNIPTLRSALSDISAHFRETGASVTVVDIVADACSAALLSHSIESIQLPTWHNLQPQPTEGAAVVPARRNDTDFAADIHFLVPPRAERGNLIPPPAELGNCNNLYLVRDVEFREVNNPISFLAFYPDLHITPDVHWMSPYDATTSTYNVSALNGLKIENSFIDGTIIPVPDVELSLIYNNSQFYQGSIPLTKVKPSNPDGVNRFIIPKRVHPTNAQTKNGLVIIDSGRNTLPIFDRQNVRQPPYQIRGLSPLEHFSSPMYAFTCCAWKEPAQPPLIDNIIPPWSSYRVANDADVIADRIVHLYYSFRPMFGLDICSTILSRYIKGYKGSQDFSFYYAPSFEQAAPALEQVLSALLNCNHETSSKVDFIGMNIESLVSKMCPEELVHRPTGMPKLKLDSCEELEKFNDFLGSRPNRKSAVCAILKKFPDGDLAQAHRAIKRWLNTSFQRPAELLSSNQSKENVAERGNKWTKGIIVAKHNADRSYLVKQLDGKILRRNTYHLRHSFTKPDRKKTLE
ncbi:Capsid protein [Frankliniella fusca]|uniref:Capsid protein n=1 Tax=Frankliniella fusca TaxID=407009 RepID=A0AAE1LQK7_9NEOP|nr:Capsid protein [Frankliniella fusca]